MVARLEKNALARVRVSRQQPPNSGPDYQKLFNSKRAKAHQLPVRWLSLPHRTQQIDDPKVPRPRRQQLMLPEQSDHLYRGISIMVVSWSALKNCEAEAHSAIDGKRSKPSRRLSCPQRTLRFGDISPHGRNGMSREAATRPTDGVVSGLFFLVPQYRRFCKDLATGQLSDERCTWASRV